MRTVNDVNLVSVGRSCVTPASQWAVRDDCLRVVARTGWTRKTLLFQYQDLRRGCPSRKLLPCRFPRLRRLPIPTYFFTATLGFRLLSLPKKNTRNRPTPGGAFGFLFYATRLNVTQTCRVWFVAHLGAASARTRGHIMSRLSNKFLPVHSLSSGGPRGPSYSGCNRSDSSRIWAK
jgi:hypothetical protein